MELPAPTKGLYLDSTPANLPADAAGRPIKTTAEVLENWFPTQRGIRVRGGRVAAAKGNGDAITTLFDYADAIGPKFFAATASAIYDVTNLNPAAAGTSMVTGQSGGKYSTAQIGTAGGNYLYAVNGEDSALLFDGTSFQAITDATTPAITGVVTANLSDVWLYQNRLYFIEKDSLSAWYLPVNAIGGAAQKLDLSGVFRRSGKLLFGSTWSLDAGDGMDDKCVFVSTDGEVAVYEGSDPSASDWQIVGRYDISPPLGRKAVMQTGGDLAIATVDGLVPLSGVMRKDPAALTLMAVSRPIKPLWDIYAAANAQDVELVKWSDNSLGLMVTPASDDMLTVNLQTGAWARQTNWRAQCGAVFGGRAFIGYADGNIYEVDTGGTDAGAPFVARYCGAFQDGGPQHKRAQVMRVSYYATTAPAARLSVAFDYTKTFPAPPVSAANAAFGYLVWDQSNWNEANWWSPGLAENQRGAVTAWRTVTGSGFAFAPQIQITSGTAQRVDAEIVKIDVGLESGGVVV